MTLVFPFAIVVHFIGLRLWRYRYKKMQKESYDRFNEIDFDFEETSEMGKDNSLDPFGFGSRSCRSVHSGIMRQYGLRPE